MISMKVLVEVFANLQEKLGWASRYVEVDAQEIDLANLIKYIQDLYDLISRDTGRDLENLLDNYLVFVNGIHAQFKGGLQTLLRDGDKVSIFPPAAGG